MLSGGKGAGVVQRQSRAVWESRRLPQTKWSGSSHPDDYRYSCNWVSVPTVRGRRACGGVGGGGGRRGLVSLAKGRGAGLTAEHTLDVRQGWESSSSWVPLRPPLSSSAPRPLSPSPRGFSSLVNTEPEFITGQVSERFFCTIHGVI